MIRSLHDRLEMAQVLAVPGDVRHAFSFNRLFNLDFGRITGIAATRKGNILLCDFDKKNLILVDSLGEFLKKLTIDSEPYDVAITIRNIGYITQPNTRTVLKIDPDRMVIVLKATCNELNTSVLCASEVPFTSRIDPNSATCFLSINAHGMSSRYRISSNTIDLTDVSQYSEGKGYDAVDIVKFHAFKLNMFCYCLAGENHILVGNPPQPCTIATIDTPTDICSDDNGHLYVSGQGSNSIHRLTQDGKVIDIPLHSQHGIKQPVAVCFNQNYTKLYVVNEWGKTVLVFDVY